MVTLRVLKQSAHAVAMVSNRKTEAAASIQ